MTWPLRIVLALAFLYFGIVKFPSDPGSPWVHVFEMIGVGQWFRYCTGIIEVVGGLLLLVPSATYVAVAMLASAMVGALLTHVVFMGFQPASVVVSVLLLSVLTIGWRYRSTRTQGG
jgi:putative oxidoreductase